MQINYNAIDENIRLNEIEKEENDKNKRIVIRVSIILIIIAVLIVSFLWYLLKEDAVKLLIAILLVFMVIIYPAVFFLVLKNNNFSKSQYKDKLKKFSKDNGFAYIDLVYEDCDDKILIFDSSSSVTKYDVIKGEFDGLPFEISYRLTKSFDNQSSRAKIGVKIEMKNKMPHMFLNSKEYTGYYASNDSALLVHDNQKLNLEGNFNKFFTLYSPKDYEREALYIFTPDLMALLIDETADFDVEIIDNHMYVFNNGCSVLDLENKPLIRRLFKIIELIGAKLSNKSFRYSYKDELVSTDRPKKDISIGYLKKRDFKKTMIAYIIIIFSLMIFWIMYLVITAIVLG